MSIEHFPKIWLPRTGQVTSFATGDDGYFQAGNPRKTRFVDNGNGTITDRATGLTWVKEPGACGGNFGSAGSPSAMTWANAVAECLALTYAGYSDWRLPNALELLSLADPETATIPRINTTFFPSTQVANYWTGTSYHNAPTYANIVAYGQYYLSLGVTTKTPTTAFVRPVRGGRINANW